MTCTSEGDFERIQTIDDENFCVDEKTGATDETFFVNDDFQCQEKPKTTMPKTLPTLGPAQAAEYKVIFEKKNKLFKNPELRKHSVQNLPSALQIPSEMPRDYTCIKFWSQAHVSNIKDMFFDLVSFQQTNNACTGTSAKE